MVKIDVIVNRGSDTHRVKDVAACITTKEEYAAWYHTLQSSGLMEKNPEGSYHYPFHSISFIVIDGKLM